jgi:hypothetical protein
MFFNGPLLRIGLEETQSEFNFLTHQVQTGKGLYEIITLNGFTIDKALSNTKKNRFRL